MAAKALLVPETLTTPELKSDISADESPPSLRLTLVITLTAVLFTKCHKSFQATPLSTVLHP